MCRVDAVSGFCALRLRARSTTSQVKNLGLFVAGARVAKAKAVWPCIGSSRRGQQLAAVSERQTVVLSSSSSSSLLQQATSSRQQQKPATAGRQGATLLSSGSGGTLKSRPGEKQYGEELRGSCFFHLFSAGNAYILSSVGVITPTCTCGSLIERWGWEANCPWFFLDTRASSGGDQQGQFGFLPNRSIGVSVVSSW